MSKQLKKIDQISNNVFVKARHAIAMTDIMKSSSLGTIQGFCLFVCLEWALDSEIQLWVGPCCGVQPLARGVGVFVTPLLPHLQREAGTPVRRSQERGYWEGSYGQFNPNTTITAVR